MHLLVSEILEKVAKAKTKKDKINVLLQNESPILKAVLRINFDPNVVMDLPEGVPPFKREESPIGHQPTTLNLEYRKFYLWLDPKQNISKLKKEQLFIEMLESLHSSEADVIVSAKDRGLNKMYKGLTESLVREAFPFTLPPVETKAQA